MGMTAGLVALAAGAVVWLVAVTTVKLKQSASIVLREKEVQEFDMFWFLVGWVGI
jgi:hypothetical protein